MLQITIWLSPENLYERIDDLVRGQLFCKYIDGPQFLAERLKQRADEHGLNSKYKSQQKDDGYYAFHFYVDVPVELLGPDSSDLRVNLRVEIQLSTQLQEVLYRITHEHYEQLRVNPDPDPSAWKWQVTTNRFRAGYVSHTLHLLEAIIMELRDASSDKSNAEGAQND